MLLTKNKQQPATGTTHLLNEFIGIIYDIEVIYDRVLKQRAVLNVRRLSTYWFKCVCVCIHLFPHVIAKRYPLASVAKHICDIKNITFEVDSPLN